MNIILDVHYSGKRALVAGVQFQHWTDSQPQSTVTAVHPVSADYTPGQLFKRELPCLLAVLQNEPEAFETVIVDVYAHLQPPLEKGLGAHLADRLPYPAIIIGVAKTAFKLSRRVEPVYRGRSKKPLFVSSLGLPIREAAQRIKQMDGKYRIPTLIKLADQLSRGSA